MRVLYLHRDWVKEGIDGDSFMHAPPTAPDGLDDTDNVMNNLAEKKINAFRYVSTIFNDKFWRRACLKLISLFKSLQMIFS